MRVLVIKLSLLVCLVLALSFAVLAQESGEVDDRVGVAELYLARDDGSGKAGEQATSFVTTDVPIYCVVQLTSATPVTVRMNLVAVAVPGVKADTRIVSTSYTTKDNQDRVNFTGRPAGQWFAGRYRVDIFVDDVPVVSREFAVQKAAQAKPSPKPTNVRSDKSRLAGPVKKP